MRWWYLILEINTLPKWIKNVLFWYLCMHEQRVGLQIGEYLSQISISYLCISRVLGALALFLLLLMLCFCAFQVQKWLHCNKFLLFNIYIERPSYHNIIMDSFPKKRILYVISIDLTCMYYYMRCHKLCILWNFRWFHLNPYYGRMRNNS